MDGIVGVTYRCNAKCYMCNIWKNPTKPEEEITAENLISLPKMQSVNITGGEPFIRADLDKIIEVLRNDMGIEILEFFIFFTRREYEPFINKLQAREVFTELCEHTLSDIAPGQLRPEGNVG